MTLPDAAWPVDRGKRLRVESLVRSVASRCDVDAVVLWADGERSVRPFPPDVNVRRWQWLGPAPRPPLRSAVDLVGRAVPWQTAVHDWSAVGRAVASWPDDYDLVWFGALDHAVRLRTLRTVRRAVVDCDDVETEKLRAFLATPRRPGEPRVDRLQRRVELPLWARLQRHAVRHADAVLVCSELDRTRLTSATRSGRADVAVVPNTYRGPEQPVPRAGSLEVRVLVVANYGTDQNVDAAAFAVNQVLPLLRRAVPGAVLRLVGRAPERIAFLAPADGLHVIGPVDDLGPELAAATVVLVPIRYGGGTRLKILEAFAHGAPVVSTKAGAEGLDVVDGEHLLLGDEPGELVEALCRVVADPALRARLAAGGQALWRDRYSPAAGQRAVDAVLDRVLPPPSG